MQDVHARLHAARQNQAQDAIAPVAKAIAAESRLLCLDEMQITDIADAMIVGRLFEGLLAAGTVIVTTSNLAPGDLYRDGLNRQLFLPFIKLIEERLDVISLDSPTDYRLGRVKAHETFLTPARPGDRCPPAGPVAAADRHRARASPSRSTCWAASCTCPQAAHGCARFSFAELCEKPLGPPDYLALAQHFRTVFLSSTSRRSNPDRRNEAKRFVLLIDTLYDAQGQAGRHLGASRRSASIPQGDHGFEFGTDGFPPEGDAIGRLVGQKNRRNLTFWSSFSSERTRSPS